MKMTETEFAEYCDRLRFSSGTREIVSEIRNSDPSRRVDGGRDAMPGFYSSAKMGFTVQFESHKVEFHLVYKLEHDPDVLEYYCQPAPIRLRYNGLSGKWVVVWHTPDYFVLRRDSAGWVECKDKNELPILAESSPNRYRLVGSKWESPAGREYAEPLGLYYEVHSSASITVDFVRNAQFLDDFWQLTDPVPSASMEAVLDCLSRRPAMTLEDLLSETKDIVPSDDIYQMLANRAIHFDWSSAPLIEPGRVHVFADEQAALQFSAAAKCDRISAGLIDLRANGQLDWNGKSWKILNVGNNTVSLLGEGNLFIELPGLIMEDLIRQGRLTYSAGQDYLEAEHPEVQALLNQASPKDLAIANRRAELVQKSLNGELGDHVLTRSERRYVTKFRQAQEIYGNGYVGLLPRTQFKGNRDPHIKDEGMRKALIDSIENEYEVPKQPTRYSCWLALKGRRDKEGLLCPSYKTYCRQVSKRPQYKQTLKRKGRRASYGKSEFYWTLERDTPRHGDRPFEICHIDHTELDIELVSQLTGQNLRRVWLTILTDAFSRRVLAFYLTFDEPSYRSCMMVLRECVRRHQRLPQILIVDGGPEFKSSYFDHIIARYNKTKKRRPPAKPRAGSICERLFGTANTQFIYNLQGNTQITKNVRQVTKSNNPQNLAVWDFKSLDKSLEEFFYEVYDTNQHKTLGMSPRAAFIQGMRNSGDRLKNIIAYNDNFLKTTAPSTRKGTAQVFPGRGVTINYFLYWSESFRDPRVEMTNVPVRYDAWNSAIAWAYVNGHWVRCYSQYHGILEGRSEKEMKIATNLLRDQMRSQGQYRLTITASKLAAFLETTMQHEALLIQRARDIESGYARGPNGRDEGAFQVASNEVVVDAQKENVADVPTESPAQKPKRKVVIYGDL